MLSCRARLGGIERGLIPPHPVQDHRELAGKGNLGLLHPGPLRKLQGPAFQSPGLERPRQNDMSRLEKDRANAAIAGL